MISSDVFLSELLSSDSEHFYGKDVRLPLSISIDSRDVKRGYVFFALPGEKTDGHLYIRKALERGARVIVAESAKYKMYNFPLPSPGSLFSVILLEGDIYEFMERIARVYLASVSPREIIAITGSVGKTTTREFLKKILGQEFNVFGAEKSYNTLVGCAVTVLQMPLDTEILVLEMGTNSPGEIAALVGNYSPTVSIITDVSNAHLEGLSDFQGVLNAKMEITGSPVLKQVFYNADNADLSTEISLLEHSIIKTGIGSKQGKYRIENIKCYIKNNKSFLSFILQSPSGEIPLNAGLFGKHQAYCLGVALAVASEMKITISAEMITSLDLSPAKGRGLCTYLSNGVLLIDDSYNANPASMEAALKTIKRYSWGTKKIAVLGEMKELGVESSKFHSNIIGDAEFLDHLILVGCEWNSALQSVSLEIRNKITWVENISKVFPLLKSLLSEGTLLLVKGSHSNRLEKIVEKMVSDYE